MKRQVVEPDMQRFFSDYMPHGEGLVLIDRVLEIGDCSALCLGSKKAAESSLDESGVRACSAVEYVGQAALAGKVVAECISGETPNPDTNPSGAIVKVRELELLHSSWSQEQQILIDVAWTAQAGIAFNVTGSAFSEEKGEALAKVELTIVDTGR